VIAIMIAIVIVDVVVVVVGDVNGDEAIRRRLTPPTGADLHAPLPKPRSRHRVLTLGSTDLLVAHLERRKRMRDRVSSQACSRVRALRGSRS
jgi:hypothetical protein